MSWPTRNWHTLPSVAEQRPTHNLQLDHFSIQLHCPDFLHRQEGVEVGEAILRSAYPQYGIAAAAKLSDVRSRWTLHLSSTLHNGTRVGAYEVHTDRRYVAFCVRVVLQRSYRLLPVFDPSAFLNGFTTGHERALLHSARKLFLATQARTCRRKHSAV